MTVYLVKHLPSGETYTRNSILLNSPRAMGNDPRPQVDHLLEAFHQQLPGYGETKLHSMPSIAKELGFAHVFVKDESSRFGLPSFKILGASWAIHKAVCKELHLPNDTTLVGIRETLKKAKHNVRLITCTDGNWGRAVARTAKILSIPATIYVPGFTVEYTQNLIRSEGANVIVLNEASYDDTINTLKQVAANTGALMVMDTSWDGYEEIPSWVSDGYETMLQETDYQVRSQTGGLEPNLVIGAVGVGSWMQAVTAHYRAVDPANRIVTVEPDTAACFKESLHCDQLTTIQTGETIMCGMNCGTPSKNAWSVLREGVYAAITVTDWESHEATNFLQSHNVNAGPCGASTLAALRKLCSEDVIKEKERRSMNVVLFSTEGNREYEKPNF